MTTALSAGERLDLTALETVVREGLATFIEVGQALAEIRDRRLYRVSHGTFEEYCHERWLLSRTRAYQLIDAAVVSTIVDSDPPANEAQARELVPLKGDEADVVAAWREAKAEAEELDVCLTAKVVRNAVQKRVARVKRERKRENDEVAHHMNSRCDGCRRTPRELEDAGVPLSSGWTSSFQDGVSLHHCWGCHTERLRQDRERREREERELAERLGEEGYRQLQEERARDERRASASKQLRYVQDMLTGGRYGPEQSFILEIARWRDSLRELHHDDIDPDEARTLDAALAEAERLLAEIRSALAGHSVTFNGGSP